MNPCGQCGEQLEPDSKSLYFCDSSCQDIWMQTNGDQLQWSSHLPADDNALSERIKSRLNIPGKEVA